MLNRQRESRRNCLRDMEENLHRAVEKGQLPGGLDIARTAIGLYAMVDGLIGNWLMDPESFDLVETGDRLVASFCQGLAAKA